MMDPRTREIVTTAFRLFQLHGYDQVSVLDICQACHITKPTFYKYVSSKKNILLAMFKSEEEFIYPNVLALYENGYLTQALFKGLTFNHSVAVSMGPLLMVNYINSLMEDHVPSFSYSPKLQQLMIRILKELISNGQIRCETDPENLYHILCSIEQGLLLKWIVSHGEFSLDREFKTILNLLLGSDSRQSQKPEQFFS